MCKNRLKKMVSKCMFPLIAFILITAAILLAFNLPRTCSAEKIIVQIEKIGNDGTCVVETYADDRVVSSIVTKGKECRFYLVKQNDKKGK